MHLLSLFFFFNDTATPEIYSLSLHDALPILPPRSPPLRLTLARAIAPPTHPATGQSESGAIARARDRKSTRLNSSHGYISYAVFCLKKKKHAKQHSLLYPILCDSASTLARNL